MRYDFVPMNEEYARTIVDGWKYGAEYAIHDYSNEADHILDSKSWEKGLFAVLNEDGELVGELTTEFFDENDDYIEYDDFSDEKLRGAEMWIGFGLKPELTGRGLGTGFVSACIEYAMKRHNYRGEYVRLGVPAFNERAITVYERVGFEVFDRVVGEVDGREFEAVQMRKRVRDLVT
jgi:ribosomal-protein-alanine N-acetyltransferase